MRFPATPGWGPLAAVVCGRLPPLAAGPGLGSPPLLAGGVRWWRCWVGPCHSWLWVSGAAPRHSWLGSAGRGGGCFRGWGFPVLCVLVARRVRVVPVLVRVVCVCGLCVGGCVGVGVPFACVCVCVCACVCGVLVVCAVVRRGVLVGAWPPCGVVGPSPLLAEVPVCDSPPLLAGFRCRLSWAFLATPG